jgi:hypothetical protein
VPRPDSSSKGSPPQAAGYSEQRQITVSVQLLVVGAMLLDRCDEGSPVALPADDTA